MTAEELIKRLKSLPPETPVLVEGYETGFDDVVYGFASLFAALLNGYSVVLARLSILITNLLGSL